MSTAAPVLSEDFIMIFQKSLMGTVRKYSDSAFPRSYILLSLRCRRSKLEPAVLLAKQTKFLGIQVPVLLSLQNFRKLKLLAARLLTPRGLQPGSAKAQGCNSKSVGRHYIASI